MPQVSSNMAELTSRSDLHHFLINFRILSIIAWKVEISFCSGVMCSHNHLTTILKVFIDLSWCLVDPGLRWIYTGLRAQQW